MRNVGGRYPAQQTQESPDFLARYSFIISIVIRAEKKTYLVIVACSSSSEMYNFSPFFKRGYRSQDKFQSFVSKLGHAIRLFFFFRLAILNRDITVEKTKNNSVKLYNVIITGYDH